MLRIVLVALLAIACDEDPAPGTADTGVPEVDAGELMKLDGGVQPDAAEVDTGAPDGGATDTGTNEMDAGGDAGAIDTGTSTTADAGADGGADASVDAGDAGFDAGVILTDGDGDTIADQHEGEGLVDTNLDGTPDSADDDSDGDGLPDAVEAGDADLATPPVDTDLDGTPDFQDTDADNDGFDDADEGPGDPDMDGIPNYADTDSDGDFIRDDQEGTADPDMDLSPNLLDPDSDGDGVADADEAGDQLLSSPPRDFDFDGIPNFLDDDSDDDFISDEDEGLADGDLDGMPDFLDIDSDNDSVLDLFEAGDGLLSTPATDTNGDGTPDYRDDDSDGDTITDLFERTADTNNDGTPDRLDLDSDGDGVPDAVEAGDADPLTLPVDTDTDGAADFLDLDSDGDGLADAVEPGCPIGTSRLSADSDADGQVDIAEIAYGSDPCDALSLIDDFYFVLPPNGPGDDDTLTFTDTGIDRADLAINVDTTGSMSGEIANLRVGLSTTIIPGVNAVVPDAAFAVSSFEDYPIDPFGDTPSGDLPFRLATRVTTDAAAAQSAVNTLQTRSGIDFPESGMESLYQIMTGVGTSWAGGNVPPFNPAQGSIPGVADGTIGGAGFRTDALPIVVHVTDAISHTERDYAVDPSIAAASTNAVRASLSAVGARVVTLSSGLLPFDDLLCAGQISTYFGAIGASDVDWYQIQGAVAGDTITVNILAFNFGSSLDPMVAIANGTAIIAQNDDISPANLDSVLTNVALTGTGPYFIAVTAAGDAMFTGTGGASTGHYLVNASRNGAAIMPTPTQCRPEDPNNRTGATPLVDGAVAVAPANPDACEATCDQILGGLHPLFADFTFPYEMSEDTGAVVPACAWDQFGAGRPAGCAANECCTGQAGAGVAPSVTGLCPLAFEVDATGAGVDAAMVAGIEALVRFSTFTITTDVRPDPAELASSGIDTTCFIHGVIPASATPPNTCAPVPAPADLIPPSPALDSFVDVTPGTVLEFTVDALNRMQGTMTPCAASGPVPRQFLAYIDVIADGVTVVDTRQVIIIVPPAPPGGQN
jgi:hypothetical protein